MFDMLIQISPKYIYEIHTKEIVLDMSHDAEYITIDKKPEYLYIHCGGPLYRYNPAHPNELYRCFESPFNDDLAIVEIKS
jgi:hypothetical protein